MSLDVESVLTGLRNARREALMSWDAGPAQGEEAIHLLNALLDVELAITHLERCKDPGADRREAERIREDAQRIQREAEELIANDDQNTNDSAIRPERGQTPDDDEPAAGDVVEAPSEVSQLARALQSKARPQ